MWQDEKDGEEFMCVIVNQASQYLVWRCVLLVSIVVWFKRTGLVEPHVLSLLFCQLGKMCVESRQMKTSHVLVHLFRQKIYVSLVLASRCIEQFNQGERLRRSSY